jgi:hypothetical protein
MIYDTVKVQSAPSFSTLGNMSYDLGIAPVAYTERIRPPATETPYPFQVTASGALLKSAEGILGYEYIDSQEKENPADGDWFLVANVTINGTYGDISSATVEWRTTAPSSTETSSYLVIARVVITGGEVDYIDQYTYGPIAVIIGGGYESTWSVYIL